ncbi:MAG TPA: LLM class flavin-dependent oxidoreductase [Cyclobacteriaceae bacterium]|nr:LLM class flavin-dependent oxidoreductase [Cyclobacteriaceae bacterium]
MNIPLSVLDLAVITQGSVAADAYKNSLDLAQQVEEWGYHRFWLAEHHNMENIGSSATPVLMAYIAGGTASIRVGSGGVMLPNHSPLIVAEQFGTLASLFPDRIDLGLGRAPGTDQVTARALRRERVETVQDFPDDVQELLQYLSLENKRGRVRAIPGEGLDIPVWLLGSSLFSAQLAAELGLPYAFASHFAPTHFEAAINLYKKNFKPSEYLGVPYVMACVNAIVADTDTDAAHLATSFYQLALGIIRQTRNPLSPPVESMENLWLSHEAAAVEQMLTYSFIGCPDNVQPKMRSFVQRHQLNEVMIVSHIYDHQARLRSYGHLVQHWN